mmetsp:Transcript_72277/g.157656  ORF Transcript_72277/g.157656 Transcript_72277/m.157656 type:complete len:81 (-) Transcript_72277:36-278(-)
MEHWREMDVGAAPSVEADDEAGECRTGERQVTWRTWSHGFLGSSSKPTASKQASKQASKDGDGPNPANTTSRPGSQQACC